MMWGTKTRDAHNVGPPQVLNWYWYPVFHYGFLHEVSQWKKPGHELPKTSRKMNLVIYGDVVKAITEKNISQLGWLFQYMGKKMFHTTNQITNVLQIIPKISINVTRWYKPSNICWEIRPNPVPPDLTWTSIPTWINVYIETQYTGTHNETLW